MPLLALGFPSLFQDTSVYLLLVLGFGFVIFFHELGHFLAAKWVGIKVEQFAVGFGHAIVSWRKGIGLRLGNTQKEYQHKLEQHIDEKYKNDPQAQDRSSAAYVQALAEAEKGLGLGETEYRLNWIPLGGYVKMLGQDDLRPNAQADDPRSYNRKSVGARMVVVSAGVIMNVILAGIGFTALFMYGFRVPPAWVGSVQSESPAQKTTTVDGKLKPLQVGDRILYFEGKPQDDFTKIGLNVALAPDGAALPIKVQHVDGTIEELRITPQPDAATSFLSMGIRQPQRLAGLSPKEVGELSPDWKELALPGADAVMPGETVIAIDGKPVRAEEFWKLDQAFQSPDGHAVKLAVKDDATGHISSNRSVQPHFDHPFGTTDINFAGMMPRAAVINVLENSSVRGKVMPGDVIVAVTVRSDTQENPTNEVLRDRLNKAGQSSAPVQLTVLRREGNTEKLITRGDLSASTKVDKDRRGLGIGLMYDDLHPVVAGIVPGSPAEQARVPEGATITAINGNPVSNWFDVQHWLEETTVGKPVSIQYIDKNAVKGAKTFTLTDDQIASVKDLRRSGPSLALAEYNIVRKAGGPVQAAYWGVTETRDFILQFYLTLRRMAGGSVSPDQLMGPIGIFRAGGKFAFKGWDWLIWFLAMISANLAVVNFLPIPIVDGGLFTFLILEKIQGKPLSARTQAIAQYVGLAFLAGVFLFVTYHDIARFMG